MQYQETQYETVDKNCLIKHARIIPNNANGETSWDNS